MNKHLVNIEISRVVEADDNDSAIENFWEQLQDEFIKGNTTLENELTESITTVEIGDSGVYVKKKYCCPICHSEHDEINDAKQCEQDCADAVSGDDNE